MESALDSSENKKIAEFKALEGWLSHFKSQHDVEFKIINYDAADININIIEEWKIKLSDITKDFNTADAFRADKFGLCFTALPIKTLTERSKKYMGGKIAKDRLVHHA